jgi:hypothetical protein
MEFYEKMIFPLLFTIAEIGITFKIIVIIDYISVYCCHINRILFM